MVGTGENVGGRHVGIGHGVYMSENGGKKWKDMGLKSSEHISKIIVSPNDPNLVFVLLRVHYGLLVVIEDCLDLLMVVMIGKMY